MGKSEAKYLVVPDRAGVPDPPPKFKRAHEAPGWLWIAGMESPEGELYVPGDNWNPTWRPDFANPYTGALAMVRLEELWGIKPEFYPAGPTICFERKTFKGTLDEVFSQAFWEAPDAG